MVGEQIGFDEGGVFQALSDPIYTKTVVKYTYKKDKVMTETTVVTNITGAHVLAAVMGPGLIALIVAVKNLDPASKAAILAGMPFGIAGLAAAWGLKEVIEGDGNGDGDSDSKIGGGKIAKDFADYLRDLVKGLPGF